MRLLVCGSRDFTDQDAANAALDRAHAHKPITLVIHGAARGADTCADLWAKGRRIPVMRFPADWSRHGRAAGPMRNDEMLFSGRPDGVCAFPNGPRGERSGTADMVRKARIAGLPVWFPLG